MKTIFQAIAFVAISIATVSCADQGSEVGRSTPIDSTIENGTAPVTYGGDDPASVQDTTMANSNDTGTKANTVSNNGDPENGVKTPVKKDGK